MKVVDSLPANLAVLKGAEIFTHGHLPIAAAFCRRLGLVDIVNRLVPSQMELKPGLVVQAMVLDTLSGRTPLYHIKDFMANQDIELLLGTSVRPETFNDTNLGRSLDAIFEAGPSKIVSTLGVRASREFVLDAKAVSYDTTSTSVWGDYRQCEGDNPPPGPVITHGHSKDQLPHLKQFMTELLCVDRGVPIFSNTLNGNSSDKTSNNKMLSQISTIMAQHGLGTGAFVYVADSAAVTENNLDCMEDNLFLSRLPATYTECHRAIGEAVMANRWVDLGTLAETPTKSNRPCASYKAFETSVTLYKKKYRALVVYSSSHDKRRQKRLDKSIAQSAQSINDQLAKMSMQFFCEADAKAAAQRVEALSENLHVVKATISTHEVRKPGRPPTDKPAPTNTRYVVSGKLALNTDAVEQEKLLAGCFVLLTNVPIVGENGMEDKKLLLTYKGQYGVESDFAFLKDPIVVNDIFLKKPHRIDALGMILVIALMVYRLMERTMRLRLKKTKKELVGWENRKTDKPTAFMMTTAIVGILVAIIHNTRILLRPPNDRQTDFLFALGLGSDVFINPNCKCQPIIIQNPAQIG
ncbi:MAG TPA: IS1634 family transposase [Thermoplasmata archaeon]|nr:MAG TPA: IS1634 family transposase [Thermoplasmata archaeon]